MKTSHLFIKQTNEPSFCEAKTSHLFSENKERSVSVTKFIKLGIISLLTLQIAYADTRGSGNVDDEYTVAVPVSKSKDGIGNMLMQSISLIGIPYRWGGNTPETGMDCSAFIRYVFKKSMGIHLPRTSAEISRLGKRIHIDQLEPGDLIFFNTKRGANTHLGMYIGDNKFIQAPRTGQNIQITELSGYYRNNFNGAKRIVQENEDEHGQTTIESYHEINNETLPGGRRASSKAQSSRKHKASITNKSKKGKQKKAEVTKSKKHKSASTTSKKAKKSGVNASKKSESAKSTTSTKKSQTKKSAAKTSVKTSSKTQ